MRQILDNLSELLKTDAQLIADTCQLIDANPQLFIAEVNTGSAYGTDQLSVIHKPSDGLRRLVTASQARNGKSDTGFEIGVHRDKFTTS